MPVCCKCSYRQSILNPGKLCKKCFEQKNLIAIENNTSTNEMIRDINDGNDSSDINKSNVSVYHADVNDPVNDRGITDLIKEFMLEDKIKEAELVNTLKDYIDHLKLELREKNKIIESLLSKIHTSIKTPTSINEQSNYSDDEAVVMSSSLLCNKLQELDNPMHNTNSNVCKDNIMQNIKAPFVSESSKWHLVGENRTNKRKIKSQEIDNNVEDKYNNDITTENRFQVLDEYSDFEHEYRNQNVQIKVHPNNDDHTFYGKRIVPGISTYAKATTQGKKICIFGDSIVKTVNKKGNISKALGKTAFVKSFGGCRVDELQHYVTPTLAKNNIGAAIIHVGTNHLHGKNPLNNIEEVLDIAKGIIDVGHICKEGGVDDIFISSITVQKDIHGRLKGKEINDLLQRLCIEHDFTYINNDNIMPHDLWSDGIHLLNEKENEDHIIGTGKLRNNFIQALKSFT